MIRKEFKKFNRRKFINSAAILSGGLIAPLSLIGSPELQLTKNVRGSKSQTCTAEKLLTDISTIPNFCTHGILPVYKIQDVPVVLPQKNRPFAWPEGAM